MAKKNRIASRAVRSTAGGRLTLKLNTVVTEITWSPDTVEVTAQSPEQQHASIRADAAVITLPDY